jgi:hypothetical protein
MKLIILTVIALWVGICGLMIAIAAINRSKDFGLPHANLNDEYSDMMVNENGELLEYGAAKECS